MPYQNSLHGLIAWAKSRLDEMDAGLAAMERDNATVQDKARAAAAKALEDARAQRAAFAARLGEIEKAAADELESAQRRLNESLHGFESGMTRWAELAERQGETLALRARHQIEAWQSLATHYRDEAGRVAAAQQARILAGVADLEQAAARQRQHLESLQKAGASSWQAMADAVAQTRRAFDEAASDMRRKVDEVLHRAPSAQSQEQKPDQGPDQGPESKKD